MNYEKKYKEALSKARQFSEHPLQEDSDSIVEYIFPELKESEGEKIRKFLIEDIKDTLSSEDFRHYNTEHTKKLEEALAWLDKQGEKKVSYTTTVETGDGGINALVTRDIEIPFGTKDSELQEATYFIPKGYYAKVEGDKVVIKKGEQKPAWSEEEEHYICQLESMVKERWALAEKAQDEEVIKNMSDLASFLKTLNPNKKLADEEMKTLLCTEYEKGRADAIADMQMEWSEDDEKIITGIINDIQKRLEDCHLEQLAEIYFKEIDWIKSLKVRI